jgi:ribosome recycling factor
MEDGIVKDILDDANTRMDKSVEATKHEFGTVRTGRASPNLLDRVQVDYYGAVTPLRQLASISASEARLLTITPYDKSSIKSIEKAILESDVGLTPSNDGNLIRLVIPELTEERRKDLAKVVRRIAEEGRVGVRNVRGGAAEAHRPAHGCDRRSAGSERKGNPGGLMIAPVPSSRPAPVADRGHRG